MNHSKLHFLSFLFTFFICSPYSSSSSYSSNNTRTRCSLTQTHALLLFKQNLFSTSHSYDEDDYRDFECYWSSSNYYPIMMNWNMSIDCCNWNGVTCNHFTGDVIGLDLSCGMLQGSIHPNTTLFNLPHLQTLNLAFNDFTDSQLPRKIGRFSNSLTHLNISYCGFIGQVPTDLMLLGKLVSLDLSRNDFKLEPHVFYNLLHNSTTLEELWLGDVSISSILPTYLNLSSSMKSLHLSGTGLQGKLPENIFNLPYLEELDLANVDIIDQFPKVNDSINIPLKWLDLSFAGLSGIIPDSISHLKSLNYLDLSDTNLSGEIPNSIGHLESLNFLDLSYVNLSGGIPNSVSHLKSLNTLQLISCGLMGPFPKSLFNLRNLTTLILSSNMFNGTLPSWLFTFPLLEVIYLDENMFSGSLPSELFNHQSLEQLSLRDNRFVGVSDMVDQGSTLQTFGKLINLTYLDLSFNDFAGVLELDTLLSSLKSIGYLDLSYSGLSVVTNNENHYVNPNVRDLDLAACKLKVFPKSLRAMKNLRYLDLSNNDITGHIPDWVGEIGGNHLQTLNLSHNFITSLPQFQWDGLLCLALQSNLIQGSFPPSICNMRNLQILDMSNNSFGGVIPQCLGNIGSSLMMIDLGNNLFHGIIPNTYRDCGRLGGIILNGNQLEGEVPSSLSKCQQLEVLDLGNNQLNGTFPHWSSHLSHLQVLVLESNKLHGPIGSSSTIKHPFPSLRVLDLSHNDFVGHLPQKYFQNFNSMKNVVMKGTKPQYLSLAGNKFYSITLSVKGRQLSFPKLLVEYTIINLSNNKFEGKIPNAIGSLNSLKALDLSHNNFDGRIPYALGNLLEIESLDLSWNRLTGEIPQSLADITNLAVLNLSQNHLVGRIPSGTQFTTFEATSFEGNLGLCGFPLPKQCEHVSAPQLERDGDEDNGFTWKVVMLGYGCGTLLGMVMGYLMLSTGKPKWFNTIADEIEYMIQRRQKKRRSSDTYWEIKLGR